MLSDHERFMRRQGKKVVVWLLFLCASFALVNGLTTNAQQLSESSSTKPGADVAADLHRQTFDIVWQTVKDKHFDPNFGGVNWDHVREEYLPRLAAIKSEPELYSLLQQMLGELNESHFAIIPPDAILDDESRQSLGDIGIDVRPVDGKMTITAVRAGSTGAAAGLKPGFVLVRVGQTPVDQILEKVRSAHRPASVKPLYEVRNVLSRVNGDPGSSVEISYIDEAGANQDVTVKRELIRDELSQPIGYFPPQFVQFESKRLAGGIGYIRFNVFVPSLMVRIREAIRSMADAPGIIFDLRGNPGGVGQMASGIAGLLTDKSASLGTMQMRSGFQKFAVFPQSSPYLGPVVLLIDQLSASTSEVMAAGLQSMGRAVIVGESSAGAALPSIIQRLPTGALFQYAIADFKTPSGKLIEGAGVRPDVEVPLTRSSLLSGHDAQLEAAVSQVLKIAASRKVA